MKKKPVQSVVPDYFENIEEAIKNMMLSGLGRSGRRRLCNKLGITWRHYKQVE